MIKETWPHVMPPQCSTAFITRWRIKSPASRLFAQAFVQAQVKESIKAPRHWLCEGYPPVTGEFPSQRARNTENVSIWWRHHIMRYPVCMFRSILCVDPISSRTHASSPSRNGIWAGVVNMILTREGDDYYLWFSGVALVRSFIYMSHTWLSLIINTLTSYLRHGVWRHHCFSTISRQRNEQQGSHHRLFDGSPPVSGWFPRMKSASNARSIFMLHV